MFKRHFLIVGISLLSFFSFSGDAFSKPPVVVEYFGFNACVGDTNVQKSLQKIIESEENVIIVNCRMWLENDKRTKVFAHKFCTDRFEVYRKKFGIYVFYNTTYAIVNGIWDASTGDMVPAINLGRADNVQPIVVNVRGDVLDISVPEIKSKIGSGEFILYAYALSQGEESVFVDPDVVLTDQMKEDIRQNKSVPFVTKKQTEMLLVRPVMGMENIGKWVGEKTSFTVSLKDITTLAGSQQQDLSYIVVLHEGDGFGRVLASGEAISAKELYNSMPQSQTLNIEFVSEPTDLNPK